MNTHRPRSTLDWIVAVTCGVVVAAAAITMVFLVSNDRTDNKQTKAIQGVINSISSSQRSGCYRGNSFREQSNARVPLERIEAQSALIVAVLVRRFDLDVPFELDPMQIRRLLSKVADVPLTPCEKLYKTPKLPEGVSFKPPRR